MPSCWEHIVLVRRCDRPGYPYLCIVPLYNASATEKRVRSSLGQGHSPLCGGPWRRSRRGPLSRSEGCDGGV